MAPTTSRLIRRSRSLLAVQTLMLAPLLGCSDETPPALEALRSTLGMSSSAPAPTAARVGPAQLVNPAFLVKDINVATPTNGSSLAGVYVLSGGVYFFTANDPFNGTELWRTDGTRDGTWMVRDIRPGSSSSSPGQLTDVNGVLFFVANDSSSGGELWRSDGTHGGTFLVKDITPGPSAPTYSNLVNVNGTLFFVASGPGTGGELWKSDGTAAGTQLVLDILPGSTSSGADSLTNVNGTLLFAASNGVNGAELWRSDGTAAGTVMVRDIHPGGGSSPDLLINVNGTLFFTANDGFTGAELWKSDGTAAGTVLVSDIRPGASSSTAAQLTSVNGTLFFSANDGANGTELWKSDGTAAGTVSLTSFASSTVTPAQLYDYSGTLVFTVSDGGIGTEFWKSDGTVAGTVLVKDIYPGTNSSSPASFTNLNGTLFFRANDGSGGSELWKSDGTAAGTVLLKDIRPGLSSSTPTNLRAAGSLLLFRADNGSVGSEPWSSDGTAAGTVLIKDISSPVGESDPALLTDVNGTLFFEANNGVNGTELWKSDGTAAGTVMVKDIAAGTGSSNIASPINVGGKLFFVATESRVGAELWVSDGTTAGTTLVLDINPGTTGSSPNYLVNLGGTLYFRADDGVNGAELWKSDGTAAGTVMVKDIRPGATGSSPNELTLVNGWIFFDANDGTNGNELWKSDGTSNGTVLVKDINPGTGGTSPTSYIDVNGTLFFSVDDVVSGMARELWKSDGTAAGTVLVKDINPGNFSSLVDNMLNAGGVLYFNAYDRFNGGMGVWKSDGTEAGTVMLMNTAPGSPTTASYPLWFHGGVVYFVASDGVTGNELWRTDGTVGGTVPVIDLMPGLPGSVNSLFFNPTKVLPGEPFAFQGSNGLSGLEVWRSNGTAAGTVLIHDIAAGAGSSTPGSLTVSGELVFFAAADPARGRELWAVNKQAFASVPPPIVCPLAQVAEATGASGAAVNYPPAVVDAVYTTVTYDLPPGSLFPLGASTVTATASNASGQTASCSFLVTVRDTTPPAITLPGTQTFEATSAAGAVVSYTPATATDAVSTPTVTHTPASGSQFPLGSTTVVVVATDAAGNAATSSFVVAVVDTTAPTITCPADQTFEATSAAGAVVNYTPATATDTVSTPTIDYSPAQGSEVPLGISAVTATATDDAGNTEQCTFQVTVQDTTAPALSLPADQTFDAQSGAGAVVTYVLATATDAVSTPVLVHTPAPGTQFPMGVTTVSVTATDAAGNTSTGSFTVTVSDLSPPVLSCPANQTFEATSGAGTTVSYTPATATDAISTPVVSHTPPSGGTFPLGSTQVTAVATDAAGNSASCTFSVIVRDTTAPQLGVPADQTFEATSAAGAVVTFTPATATDAVSTPTVTHDPQSGSQFPLGATVVQVTAVDAAGNSAAGSFTVRVVDTTAPAIACPADQVFEAASGAGAVVGFTPATATDAVSSVTPSHSPASQTSFPLGVTTVTAVAQDAAGNSASCTFTVTVADSTAPAVSCPGDQVVEATGPAGATVSYPAAQASDPVSIPTLAYSQAPGSQFGLGQTAVTVTATDAAGNAASCSFAVTVQDTTPPALTCPADVTVDGNSSGATVTYPDAVATDAVSTPAVTYGQPSGSTFPAGTTPVTVTATDGARNTSTCTFTVTVNAPPGGCGCQATGGVAPLGWALAMVLARVALRRRARWIRR